MISYENYRTNKRTGQVPLFNMRKLLKAMSNLLSLYQK